MRSGRTGILLGLTMLVPLLAYGLAQLGLRMMPHSEEPERSALRNFARWLLLSVPLATLEVASGDGMAALLGAIAIWVAGRHIGLQIALWRYVR
jgi:hypothetical protein